MEECILKVEFTGHELNPANPDNVIEYDSYALYTDHIMGFGLTE